MPQAARGVARRSDEEPATPGMWLVAGPARRAPDIRACAHWPKGGALSGPAPRYVA